MATSKKSNNQSIRELIDIDEQLVGQREALKVLTQQASVYSAEVQETLRNYTGINNAIRESAKELAKLKSGKDSIAKAERLLADLMGEQVYNADKILNTTAKMTAVQEQQLKLALDEQEIIENRKADILESIKLQKQHIIGSQEYLKIEEELANLNELRDTAQRRLVNKLDDEIVAKAFILQQQKKDLENSTKLVENFVKSAARSRGILGKDFWQDIVGKAMPRLAGFTKSTVTDMMKFGKAAGLAGLAIGGIALIAKSLVDAMFRADQQSADLARSLSISREESRDLLTNFEAISNEIEEGLFSSIDVLKAQMAVNSALGTAVLLRNDDLKTSVKLMEMLGLTEESVGQIAKFSAVSSKSFEDIKNEILGASKASQIQSGVFLNDKKILEAVLKTTGAIRANFKGSTKEMAAAVVQAKMLGTTLEGVNKTSEFLLDFEQSIQAEMKAELLTGKQLNMERARSAALVGDMSTVMSEMNKQAGSFEEIMSMNVIQQKALAENFGMSRDEFTDMMFEQTAVNRLRSAGLLKEQQSLIDNYNRIKREGGDVAKLLGKDVAQKLEFQSAQERLNKVFEKFMSVLDRLVQNGVLDKLVVQVANFATWVSKGGLSLKSLFGAGPKFEEYTSESLGIKSDNVSTVPQSGTSGISTPRNMLLPNNSTFVPSSTNNSTAMNNVGNSTNMESKLDTMIALMRKEKGLYMDSVKVGTSQAMSQYNYA